MAVTDELVYSIDLAWDKIGFKNLDASINQTVKAFAVATAAVSAASAAIFAMSKSYAQSTDNLIKTAGRVNATTESIQKLTFAAEDNGATIDDVTSSLGSLAKQQEELLRGKGDFEAWGRLGVNPTEYENTADLLLAISDSVKDLGSTEAIDLMSRVGISPQLLQTLQHGSDGLGALGAELEALGGVSTKDMLKSSQDFMSGWQRASTITTGILNKVSSQMLNDTINPAIKAFNKFASKNMKKISEVITKIFEAVAKASEFIFSMITRLAQPFVKLVDLFGGLEKAAIALGVAITAIKYKTIAAMLPAILVVGALYLAFDEVMSFLHGEESYIGDFFDAIGVGAEDARGFLMALGNPLDRFIELLKMSYDGWTNLYDWMMYGIEKVTKGWKDLMKWIDELVAKFNSVVESASNIGGSIGDFASNAWEGTKNFFGGGEQATPQPVTTNNVSFQIDGSQNPEATAEAVRRVMNEELNKSAQRGGF